MAGLTAAVKEGVGIILFCSWIIPLLWHGETILDGPFVTSRCFILADRHVKLGNALSLCQPR